MKVGIAIAVAVLSLATAPMVLAQNWHRVGTNLIGYEEVPAVSTVGNGEFDAHISRNDMSVDYELRYRGLGDTVVQQAHIHFGQTAVNGGISVFLCSNLGNGPAGTQPCPQTPGDTTASVNGTFTATDVIGPAAQEIRPGELAELLAAIRAGVAYVNVHTTRLPGGEIRGQLGPGHSH